MLRIKVVERSPRVKFTLKFETGHRAELIMISCRKEYINLTEYSASDYPKSDVYYIESVKVDPVYRSKGYGGRLVKAAIRWARKNKKILVLDAIPLDTDIDPFRLKRFYLKYGFKMANPNDLTSTSMIQYTLRNA